jgi:hypothetical protein
MDGDNILATLLASSEHKQITKISIGVTVIKDLLYVAH